MAQRTIQCPICEEVSPVDLRECPNCLAAIGPGLEVRQGQAPIREPEMIEAGRKWRQRIAARGGYRCPECGFHLQAWDRDRCPACGSEVTRQAPSPPHGRAKMAARETPTLSDQDHLLWVVVATILFVGQLLLCAGIARGLTGGLQ
jgi:hypothetical protein